MKRSQIAKFGLPGYYFVPIAASVASNHVMVDKFHPIMLIIPCCVRTISVPVHPCYETSVTSLIRLVKYNRIEAGRISQPAPPAGVVHSPYHPPSVRGIFTPENITPKTVQMPRHLNIQTVRYSGIWMP